MINPMQQVVVAGRQSDSRAVMQALQRAGVLHIVPLEAQGFQSGPLAGQAAEERRDAERLLARTESTLGELGAHDVTRAALPAEDQWSALVEQAAAPAGALTDREAELRTDLDTQRTYTDVVAALARAAGGADRSRRLALIPLTVEQAGELQAAQDALRAELGDRFAVGSERVNERLTAVVVAVLAADRDRARVALGKARLGELRLPGRFERLPLSEVAQAFTDIARTNPPALEQVAREKAALAAQHGATVAAIRDALADRVGIDDARAQTARGKYGFVLQGYVPEDRIPDLQRALEPFKQSAMFELHPVDEHHAEGVPVQLKNSSYTENFEFMLNISDPPRYGTFDPSWVVAWFFPLFFGFIVADIGFGLLFLLAALWGLARARRGESLPIGLLGITLDPATLKRVGVVLQTMSLWSILWGILTGEFFGNVLEKLHVFYVNPELIQRIWGVTLHEGEHASGLIPILFPRVLPEFSNTIMLICIAVGVIFMLWSWGLKAQLTYKHKHMHHFWEAVGMLGGLVGLILLAYVSRAGQAFGALGNFANPLVLVMLVGFVVFLVGLFQARNPLMLIEILSNGGNIISFTRLFAVGVAAAILANLATDVGWGLGGVLPIIGPLLGIILGLIVHTFLFALTILGHVMQPIRLVWVEYLNPTGFYQETGTRYAPFAPAARK
ncbi:V/A-type H+-transporting ATPase subunit I [Deinococcus metalli]|uniref:V-type ATP synthase subunit I n=1 Tax=Deinococcus metalli TaxID=1141878 RepID=A0A7W8NTA0_9DEIO|nr:V-type ATPase 116kDa subunit family protein [Deinococcus metalli]MBB5377962.1 V/A-type H+-transporting ATPase subunit I [Deinococcus metalli]GHF54828.1 v-type ATP synthase subunit I [Deinococcus metalli]